MAREHLRERDDITGTECDLGLQARLPDVRERATSGIAPTAYDPRAQAPIEIALVDRTAGDSVSTGRKVDPSPTNIVRLPSG
jgi:hypothetical protein